MTTPLNAEPGAGRLRIAIVALSLVSLLGSGAMLYAARHAPPPVVITTPTVSPIAPNNGGTREETVRLPPPAPPNLGAGGPPKPSIARLYVHVAGAVTKPSLYLLRPGDRVLHAIKAAGGPTAKADLDALNLAEKVRDGEKVYVPRKGQYAAKPLPPPPVPPGNALGYPLPKKSVSPMSARPAALGAPKTAKGKSGKPGKLSSPTQGQININTADDAQLERLPGIGPAMAARILAYRHEQHGFRQIDELMQVGGIGPKKFARIEPLVKLH